MVAVETGPTNRFQRFSTSSTSVLVKAVGFATAVPPSEVDVGGVGMIEVEFWAAARPASTKDKSKEIFILSLKLKRNCVHSEI
jgi:hypothetical protein